MVSHRYFIFQFLRVMLIAQVGIFAVGMYNDILV